MKTIGYFWRAWSLMYFEQALQSLTKRDPCHPDIPEIMLKISELKEKQK